MTRDRDRAKALAGSGNPLRRAGWLVLAGATLLVAAAGRDAAAQTKEAGSDPALSRVIDAGGKIGAVNVVLLWNSVDDLDLHVTCPNGEKINYLNRLKCGGALDIDMNGGGSRLSTTPVESVSWPAGASPPPGIYKVEVSRFRSENASPPTEFTVKLLVNGEVKEAYELRAASPGSIPVFEFGLPYAGPRR
jgi:hypothetical protein